MGAAVATVVVVAAIATAQSSSDKWWPGYSGGPDNSRYFASSQINKGNVSRLDVAWTYPYGETGFHPIAVRGVVYGRGRNGSLVAVDAKTGRELWVRENMNGMTSRGINYWESADGRDRRLIFSMNSLLQEVDARSGRSMTSFGTNGVVDLREGLDGRDPASAGNIQSNTPGEVFENLIILGSATGEGYMSAPGDIRAYDVLTGRLVWTFHTVPRPGEFGYETWPKDAWKYIGGVNNWGEMTVDIGRGIVYIPLGSPTYDFYGADRIGSNLFGTSIVALEARTGKRLWHFQLVHHDLWDMDPSAAPQLTTIRHDGRTRDVVAVASKLPWLYVFDRVTGEPIWPIEERPVPKSEMPGEQSWPTQPIPTQPPPFAKLTFGVDDISPYLPAEEAEAFRSASAWRRGMKGSSRPSATPIRCMSRRATAACSSAAWRPNPREGRSTSSRTTTPASCVCCVPVKPRDAAGRRCRRDNRSISRTASRATVPIDWGRTTACRWCMPQAIRRTTSRLERRASTPTRSAPSSARERAGCPLSRTSRVATSICWLRF